MVVFCYISAKIGYLYFAQWEIYFSLRKSTYFSYLAKFQLKWQNSHGILLIHRNFTFQLVTELSYSLIGSQIISLNSLTKCQLASQHSHTHSLVENLITIKGGCVEVKCGIQSSGENMSHLFHFYTTGCLNVFIERYTSELVLNNIWNRRIRILNWFKRFHYCVSNKQD